MPAKRSQTESGRPQAGARVPAPPDGSLSISFFKDGNLTCDADWRITEVDDHAELMLRHPRREVLGKVFWDAFPITRGTEVERAYRRVITDRVSFGYELHYKPADLWFDVRVYPSITGGACINFREITHRKRRESTAETNQNLLRMMIESMHDYAIFSLDPKRCVTSWNAGAERLFGYAEEEILGKSGDVIYTPEDRASRVPEIETDRAAKDGKAEDKRWHVRRDGSRFFAAGTVRPMLDPEGKLRGFVKIAQDVSEIRRTESALQQQANLLDLSHDAILIWEPEGAITYWNQGAEELYGYPREAAVGQKPHELLQTRYPESPVQFAANLEREQKWTGELCHTCRDGRNILVESRQVLIHQPDGKALVLETNRDITERDKAEEALREREAQLQLAIDIGEMGTFEIDLLSDEVAVNEIGRKIYGWGPAEPLTFSQVREQFHPEDRERVDREVAAAMEPGGSQRFEIDQRIVRRDGTIRWLRVFGRVSFDGEGENQRPVRCLGTYTDTTALKEAESLLREANRRKDEFLAMLAHELRNPLAAIRNAIHVLDSGENDPETMEWSRGVLDRQSGQLARLVDDLLDVSRITSGKIRLRKEVLDTALLLDHSTEVVRPLVTAREHELLADYPHDRSLLVEADATRLEQVFANLLTNAAKYMESGGKIWVKASREAEHVVISIRDTGVGIPAEKLPQMFELFAQGERSIARSEGGLGIGLTIVRTLVEMHGGTVTATSEGVGKGSEFTIRLPAITKGASASIQTAPENGDTRTMRDAKVLLVDDHVDTAQGMRRLLSKEGYTVEIAHEGRAALERAKVMNPDIVLLDIGLPGMDGFQVAEELRHHESCQHSLFIAISGYGQAEDFRQSRAAGFNHHLVKPIDYAELRKLLDQWCKE